MILLPIFFLALQAASPAAIPIPTPILDEPLTLPAIVYPAQARKDRIQGVVKLQVDVDLTGHVTAVHALDGPIQLRQAAIDAYSAATYRPIVSRGHATPAIITTTVNFALAELPPDNEATNEKLFQSQHNDCQQLSLTHSPTALLTCREAVQTSQRLSPQAELEARATAYNDLVLLLIADGKRSRSLPEAGRIADQAVALVAGSNVHRPAVAVAYITRAEVRSLAGNLKGAEADCSTAEETLQTLMADEAENDKAASYRGQMRELIELHAVILERDHKKDQARQIRQRGTLIQ